ncbi:hypothetical protein [Candidatus Enterovibrio escicola]|uniref:Mobile element protein n=1 Tax=Candidatus Enterovibrio escicola TaxID=1927127 RepID=A0A2A5T307_9GAMM|nr:hypothetical protein [Candidatus Enterovibrio escacola]PCS22510.1 hypothetical protein BTN49_1872 [Candidatus Enterovibrio escacola]
MNLKQAQFLSEAYLPREDLHDAVLAVLIEGMSVYEAERTHKLPACSLGRAVKKIQRIYDHAEQVMRLEN